ncbi:hypothetical protein D9619_001369 [Psilocybe cf. subviscida]|uniref:Uncharacterized protein n=1 Tax=Psilocybe cf. subviscida TaxID=2480587 RepID=A0A8H5BFQ3_9AGAR|nr:hypothetical protein D9619_001369 [Psilocybe cf. subviscida]
MGEACRSTVLGKRKSSSSKGLVLHLSPRPTSDASLQETDGESASPIASTSKTPFVIINGVLQPDTKKRYRCTVRLSAQHARNLTSEKPICMPMPGRIFQNQPAH